MLDEQAAKHQIEEDRLRTVIMSGASSTVVIRPDDEPICRQTGSSSSAQVAKKTSQYQALSWIDGWPSLAMFSLKITPRAPVAAVRRTSAAAVSVHGCGVWDA